MKQLTFFIFLLTLATGAAAQADSVHVWNKWCSRKDSLVLFTGGYNLIQVYCPNVKPADLKIKSLDKSLRIGKPEIKGDTLSVMAMPFRDKSRTMRLSIMQAKNSKLIKTVNFNCDTIPPLVATLGTLKGTEAKRKDILAQMTLKASFPGSLYSYPYAIKQYTFKINTPKGGATMNVKGFFISNDILKEINAAPDGTIVLFTEIKATCPECAVRTLNEIKMTIR